MLRGRALGQVAQDLPAVHAGHHHVQRNQVGASLGRQLERFWPAARVDDLVVMRREVALEELVDGLVIVNYEHTGLAGARQADGHLCPGLGADVGGQAAALLVDEQLDHLPFFVGCGQSVRRTAQNDVQLLAALAGLQRNHASGVLGHQA